MKAISSRVNALRSRFFSIRSCGRICSVINHEETKSTKAFSDLSSCSSWLIFVGSGHRSSPDERFPFSLGLQLCNQSRELADVREPDKFSAREFFFRHDFVLPGGLVRDVNRAAAHFDHRQDVRPDRIADHQEAMGRDLVPGDDGLIGLSDFYGDDFDLAEKA